MMNEHTAVEPAIGEIFARFFDGTPVRADVIDTGTGEGDFRNTVLLTTAEGERFVLKLAVNDFTFSEKIRMWQRTVEEYRALGYYCPRIFSDKGGDFPTVAYHGHDCVVHGEEFSRFRPLEDRAAAEQTESVDRRRYMEDIWSMTAKIAAKKLSYTDYPSAYCLFETFCPSDERDEVLENALEWKCYADALPAEFSAQVRRIWGLWTENRESLRPLYGQLPTSVFQADLNPTNLLIDEVGHFRGIYDFNLCGRDVFLNYVMRENLGDFEPEIDRIRQALRIASQHYTFSEAEKAAALPLYRCLKPLWYTRISDLQEAGEDRARIQLCLDQVEHYLTADIDFTSWMGCPDA